MRNRITVMSASALVLASLLAFGVANADTLSVSCSGAAATSSITWTATTTGGVPPIALMWGNGATTSPLTLSYAPGTYSMDIQATDASSSTATSTCSANVAAPWPVPTITSFTAAPASVLIGQSSLLTWSVGNASSTSIDQGVGLVTGTSIAVAPTTTTTYTLSAVNLSGTSTAQASVTVNATSTGTISGIQQQIQALLQQIRALQLQLAQLIASQVSTTTPPVIPPPGQAGTGYCIALNRGLHLGDRGDDVLRIQQMLASNPAFGFNASTTGFFGPLTARAMIRFQELNGIASSSDTDGGIGPLTRGFFERACGRGLQSDAATSTSASDAVIPNISNIGNTITNVLFGGNGGDNNGRGNGRGRGDN